MLDAHHEALTLRYDELQKNHGQLLRQHQQQSRNFENKRIVATALEVSLTARNEQISSLTKELSAAGDKIRALRHDHQCMSQEKAHLEGQFKQLQNTVHENYGGN